LRNNFAELKNSDTFWNTQKNAGDPIAFVGSIFGNNNENPLQTEMTNKMGVVLEETLMQNIQLQDDIRNIAIEKEKFETENNNLKKLVIELQSKNKY